ncbi:MAG: hypothetical protein DWQ07_08305 [Chloroflexi bacterium]|nr:MAG: hypothetical protein DWQ07_08305 [Chloroflexota bacterium]MBL1193287.1 hypothetical protein [Chloroflexota bacterium]NOH10579.1 hypothetical protein [Chloroflexota bacterium]
MTDKSPQINPSFISRMARWFTPVLSTMIVLYGITTAYTAFQQSQVDNMEGDAQIVGLLELARSNDAYSVADRKAVTDFDAITQILVFRATGADQEASNILEDTLSDEALASLFRSNDLDEDYYDLLYAEADALYDNAFIAFGAAGSLGNIRTGYDIALLILAVGLGFAGWSSLLGDDSKVGFVFGTASIVLFVIAVVILFNTLGLDMPAEVKPLAEFQ